MRTTMTSNLVKTVGALAAMATMSMASGCARAHSSEAKPARPVKAEPVSMARTQAPIRYSATIEPYQQVPLAFKTSGYVEDLVQRTGPDGRLRAAQAGDHVAKGAVLARVREADNRERVTQGRAKLSEGEASLEKARLDLERARTLFAADSLTKPDLDAAQAAFDAAQARKVAAQADIELAVNALRDCTLVAPATGVLLERRIEIGTLVGAGSVGFLLGDVSAVKARFGIPDAMIQSVKLGDRIGVTVEAVAGTSFPGRITALAPTADPQSRVFDVEVTIPNADGRLRPGMIGSVELSTAAAPAASRTLTIPLTAVVRAGGDSSKYAVVVVESKDGVDVARMRPVELGEVTGSGIAVVKGISLGDRVVVSGATMLVDGEPIRVISGE